MRVKLFLLNAICLFLVTGRTTAFGQKTETESAFNPPQFINGIFTGLFQSTEPLMILNDAQTIASGNLLYTNRPAQVVSLFDEAVLTAGAENDTKAASTETEPVVQIPNSRTTPSITVKASTPAENAPVGPPTLEETLAMTEEVMDPVAVKYAEVISVEPNEIANLPLYRFIDKWYGTRYKWGGNDMSGIDCSAFSKRLYNDVYGQEIQRTSREQHRSCVRIKDVETATEGDLIFFRMHRIRVSHVGIYLANGFFVHSSRSHGVVISSLNDKYWSRRYAGCGRIEKEDKFPAESDYTP